jgi:hypothetical protein
MFKRAALPEQRSVSKGAHAEVIRKRVEGSFEYGKDKIEMMISFAVCFS